MFKSCGENVQKIKKCVRSLWISCSSICAQSTSRTLKTTNLGKTVSLYPKRNRLLQLVFRPVFRLATHLNDIFTQFTHSLLLLTLEGTYL